MKALKAVTIIVCTMAILITCTVVVVSVLYPDLVKKDDQETAPSPSYSMSEPVQKNLPASPTEESAPILVDEPSPPALKAEEVLDYTGIISEPTEFNYNWNHVDGITLTWRATNQSDKEIKYYTARVKTLNSVGDPSFDDHNNKSTFKLNYVGPIEPGGDLLVFQLFTYQGALHSIIVEDIELEFMDGTKQTVKYGFQTSDDSGFAK